MVCYILLYNKVNQLYICPHISSLLHLPPSQPPYPTPLDSHKAPSWGFPGGAVVENLLANAGDTGSSPGLGGSRMPRSN